MKNKLQTTAILLLAISIVILALVQIFGHDKLAYINSAKIMNEYKGMIDAREEFKEKSAVWQHQIDSVYLSLETLIKEYEKNMHSYSSKEKQTQHDFIEKKKNDFDRYRRVLEEKAKLADREMTEVIVNEINTYIKDYGKRNRYKIIFGITEYGNVVYGSDDIDITEELLIEINQSYKK